jgi:hypothetical protein
VRVVDIEPETVIAQLGQVIPVMRARLLKLLSAGPMRTSRRRPRSGWRSSHYIVRSDDDAQFLAQLRHAVGIK